ncbi:MAG TPA: CDP-diacylglycerol--serine O-phosphatidyltransferase [Candidatus Binataceae bacterium]|nr:CDP-diacylglycerol--serine O-phosphatidyltransferase [Candidatus Binataceae bacterium]
MATDGAAPGDEHVARLQLISGRLLEKPRPAVTPPRRGVFVVPATITSLGLLAGFYSMISSIDAHFEVAAVMIALAFICDGLDGRVARLSRSSSQFGIELDSLSDVVAFGAAPAILTYAWAMRPLGGVGAVISGLYVIAGALRLARFNVQTGSIDKRRFVGLPVPGAAGMIAGVVLAYSYFELNSPRTLCAVIAPVTLALAGLMVSRVPYPSFKGIDIRRRAPLELMLLVLLIAAMLIAMPQFTTFVLATAYVLSGPFMWLRGERIELAPDPSNAKPGDPPAGGAPSGKSVS